MKIGAIFPQVELGPDPAVARDFAQAVEDMGFDHLVAFDHVVGANKASRPGWSGPYDHTCMFHEPLVLFGWLAALTKRIELTTGILILPQRQAVLVAKQAAEVAVLSGGRLRLGVGVGWNAVEYEALGENFRNRGRRSAEQVDVLRRLWGEELVSFTGEWHRIEDAGLNPLPPGGHIPVWFGGHHDAVLERVARQGDGWMPLSAPSEKTAARIRAMRDMARTAGRDPDAIGIECWVRIGRDDGPEDWAKYVAAWKAIGATHATLYTADVGLVGVDAHLEKIRLFKEAMAGV